MKTPSRNFVSPVLAFAALAFNLSVWQPAQAASFINTSPLAVARWSHTATLLPDGTVLVAGGIEEVVGADAAIYVPATATWKEASVMNFARYTHTATLLPNGKVLVAGGEHWMSLAALDAELYDPIGRKWVAGGAMNTARWEHTSTLLPNGKVLVAGGMTSLPDFTILSSSELFDVSELPGGAR